MAVDVALTIAYKSKFTEVNANEERKYAIHLQIYTQNDKCRKCERNY